MLRPKMPPAFPLSVANFKLLGYDLANAIDKYSYMYGRLDGHDGFFLISPNDTHVTPTIGTK